MVVPELRWLLGPFVLLAVGSVAALFVNTRNTDDTFAWTIAPPFTAALLGAAYAGALILFVLVLREKIWANARIAVPAPFVLSTLTLIATLVHLDKFHLDADLLPAAVAWIWLVVYCIVPPAMIVLAVRQLQAPGTDPPRTHPMPAWFRAVMIAYGAAGVIGGMFVFLSPTSVIPHWPWLLTPLTARALAAWFVALGVAAFQGAWEHDLRRVRAGLAAFAVIGGLGLIAVARFSDDIRWAWAGWTVVGVLVLMLVAGGLGWQQSRTRAPCRGAPDPG